MASHAVLAGAPALTSLRTVAPRSSSCRVRAAPKPSHVTIRCRASSDGMHTPRIYQLPLKVHADQKHRAPPRVAPRQRAVATQAVATSSEGATTFSDFPDEDALLAESTFAIKPDELVAKAKAFMMAATKGSYDADAMASTFEFVGPVVGPLGKEEFLTAIGSFDLKSGIPDLCGNMIHFRVDPFMPSRVWFTTMATGTHSGKLAGVFEPTGKTIRSPPQSCSLTFNEEGQVIEYTIGYVMDRRLGNTGGLGGVFAIFYAIGKPLPFPEANPWQMSKRYSLFQLVGKINSMLKK